MSSGSAHGAPVRSRLVCCCLFLHEAAACQISAVESHQTIGIVSVVSVTIADRCDGVISSAIGVISL